MKMNSDRNLARCKKEVVENASRIDSTCSCRGDVAVSRRKPCGASGCLSFSNILHFGWGAATLPMHQLPFNLSNNKHLLTEKYRDQ